MKNNTKSKVVITMNNIDNADRLYKALSLWFDFAETGGDAHIIMQKGNGNHIIDCGMVGHDVEKLSIEHIVEDD